MSEISREFSIQDDQGNIVCTIKLIEDECVIFVKGEKFMRHKFVPITIPLKDTPKFKDIESINDIIDHLDHSLERDWEGKEKQIALSLEEEFFVNCLNLQAWVESDYNTRLLDYRLSFPLLKKMAEKGNKRAEVRFKEEVSLRFHMGSKKVKGFLEEFKEPKHVSNMMFNYKAISGQLINYN